MPDGDLNPDFRYQPEVPAIVGLIPEQQRGLPWVQHLVALFSDRDRQLADYLNRQVVRRVEAVRATGSAATFTGTAWQSVTPTIAVTFYKAQERSKLVVTVHASGEYTDAAAPSWVEFGVLVNGVDYPIARGTVNATGTYHAWSGTDEVGLDLAPAAYTVTLRVRGQNAGTAWASASTGSMSLSVTESL